MQGKTPEYLDEEDEIDLRELFATIERYKWSILFFSIFITFLVAVKVYFMPKYYKSSVTIEVKPSESNDRSFALGGAAAMLLGGGGSLTTLEKDITLLKTYRTNEKVLDKVNNFMVRYFITDENYKEKELEENISIEVTDVSIPDFKDYGMRLIIKPLNKTQYKLLQPGTLFNTTLGTYHYSETVRNEDFSLMVHKKKSFETEYTIELLGTKRYVYENIINENLSIEADKTSPFITLSFLDNLPHRGEAYLKNLIEIYTKQSINDIKDDALTTIHSYEKQLKKVEKQVDYSSRELESFKSTNSIISPQRQGEALVDELSRVEIEIAQNNYKIELISRLIQSAKKHKNISAIAPSLVELGDEPTISLLSTIQEQELNLATLQLKYKQDHPILVKSNQTIYKLKNKVLANLKSLKQTLKNKTISLEKLEESYQAKLKTAPKKEQKLISFSRDYTLNEKVYLYLMQQKAAAELKHDKALSSFKIIEEIYTPDKAEKPKKALIVMVAFITSLILMIFIAFFREFLKNSKMKEHSDESSN